MALEPRGYFVPVGGGDEIPLIRNLLTLGRRESCDICLRFANISGIHAELTFRDGYWFIRDLNSTNGIKVNGLRVLQKVLLPGDEVRIGKRSFRIQYELPTDRRLEDIQELMAEDIMSKSLLERAGLERRKPELEDDTPMAPRPDPDIDWQEE